jgi:serine/arginine repetitive matrix protein 2
LRPTSPDSASKANALLDSVVNSIQAPRTKTSSTPIELKTDTDIVASSATESEPSSATRRKNALAQVLFGASDSERSLTTPSPPPTEEPTTDSAVLHTERPPLIETSSSSRSLRETLSPSSPSVNDVLTSSSATEPLDKRQELVKEVQRRTEAAMADLNKIPSNPKVNDSSQRKRIEVGQISGPKLVSASTSVDTIPVRSPSAASGQLSQAQNQFTNSSKLGTRFKKFRGSLRAKPTLPGSDGFALHSADLSSANDDRSLAGTPDRPPPFSAIEPARSKVTLVAPPASAGATGPGLKSLVSRFLKPRSGDTPEPDRRKQVPSSSPSLATTSFSQQQSERDHETGVFRQTVRSAPPDNKSFRPQTPVSPASASPVSPPPSATSMPSSVPEASAARTVDETALKQFIDAANNLGLDQDALTEFLARSPSIGSRLTSQSSKHMSTLPGDRSAQGKSDPPLSEPTPSLAAGSSAHRNLGQSPQRPSGEVIAKAPIRRPLARNAATAADSTNSTILRRTLIFPSEAKQSISDSGAGLRKSSSTRRRRSASAASVHSNPSLHDRVPTPPPPKSPISRRFSTDKSPPVPHIPGSFLTPTEAVNASQSVSAFPLEKSNSAYDSL